MYTESRCPCCNAEPFKAHLGLVAPFIASYVLKQAPRATTLLECAACGFRFFEERFTDAEVTALYSGYRGDAYFTARHKVEPWYTRSLNDSIGSNEEEIKTRKAIASKFIRDNLPSPPFDTILDYGGDRGQFIPDDVARHKFVYDISGVPAEPGVESIASEQDLQARSFDMVMLCHVLEHLSDPSEVLTQLRSYAKPQGSYFFVEVPYERYNLRFAGKTALYSAYLNALSRLPKPLVTALDFYSTLFRVRFATIPPLGFAKLSEHINFYNPESLRALLERNDYRVLGTRIATEARTTVGFQGTVLCLAQATPIAGQRTEAQKLGSVEYLPVK